MSDEYNNMIKHSWISGIFVNRCRGATNYGTGMEDERRALEQGAFYVEIELGSLGGAVLLFTGGGLADVGGAIVRSVGVVAGAQIVSGRSRVLLIAS